MKLKYLKTITDKVVDLVYPSSCVICDKILNKKELRICETCRAKVSYVSEPTCFKCGKEINNEEEEYCADCMENARSYICGFPAINYEEPFKGAITSFKYKNNRDNAVFFADQITKSRGADIKEIEPDVLIPVPVHKSKKKTRGYNQAELIAKELGKKLNIPVDTNILCRVSNTSPQKNLDPKARETNLYKAFEVSDTYTRYTKVLLVDDIYTTGATIEACTKVLMEKGIKNVYYTSVCIGKGY